MKSRHKIAIAKGAYQALHVTRSLVGLTDNCVVQRNGVTFELDLSEGIDLAIFLRGKFEPATANALERNIARGSVVVDVGANIGAHSLHMAKLVGDNGKVLAFEPTGFAFEKLKRNLEHNPTLAGRVQAHQFFLATKEEEPVPAEIYSSWPLVAGDGLHEKHLGQPKATAKAISRRLDSVLAQYGNPTIHLVKLDVDGFECDVLGGAQDMMRRDRPVFVIELAPYVLKERGASLGQLVSFFQPLGYRFFDERSDRLLPGDESQLSGLIADGESINVIARV